MAKIDYTIAGTKAGFILTEEQQDIVEELIHNRFYFNCAQTGVGKTYSTITAAIRIIVGNKDKDFHFVLVLPNSAIKAFTDTLGKIVGLPYNIYTTDLKRTMKGARFHIFTYNTLSADLFSLDEDKQPRLSGTNKYYEILKKLRTEHKNLWLVCDEAHALQEPTTNQFMLVKLILPLFVGAWGLTATPILNSFRGFFEMVNLFIPGVFGNWWQFRNRYCMMEERKIWGTRWGKPTIIKKVNEVIGYKNLDRLQREFDKISVIRSKYYDYEILYRKTKLSQAFIDFYKYAAAGLFSGTMLKSGKVKKSKQGQHAARLHDLQRVVSNSHTQFKAIEDPRKLTPKEVLLIETIKEVRARGEATLIYFTYHETINRVRYILHELKDKLGITDIYEITGKISSKRRKEIEDLINPNSLVLITSAGTESVNLQRANNLIFYETPFPLREFIQACGRIMRINSTYNKFRIYVLEVEGTIDTYKKNRIIEHSVLIRAIMGGSNVLPTEVLILNEADRKEQKKSLLWWHK